MVKTILVIGSPSPKALSKILTDVFYYTVMTNTKTKTNTNTKKNGLIQVSTSKNQ